MLELYKNKTQKFKCDININNGKFKKATPRLIISPNNDDTRVYEGRIEKNTCIIDLPAMLDINEGQASLEVIVDDSILKPWRSDYKLKNYNVTVENISVNTKQVVTESKRPIKSKNIEDKLLSVIEKDNDILAEMANMIDDGKAKKSLFKESCSKMNRTLVKGFIKSVNGLPKEQKESILEDVKQFNPDNATRQWSNKVFASKNNMTCKIAVYCKQNLLHK